MTIPIDVAAKVLFQSDRTCCVCRIKGKSVQIHHIDEDRSNNDIKNLSVLCLECHTDTQIQGGFHRKLNAEQVILYRDDWHTNVERRRALESFDHYQNPSTPADSDFHLELVTSEAEIYRENQQYEMLAMLYDRINNHELRDKYIELALEKTDSVGDEVFFRSLQDRVDLVSNDKIDSEIERYTESEDWSQLARFYLQIKDYENAVKYYCRYICGSLEDKRTFSAAYYLREMIDEMLHVHLFEESYRQHIENNDLWWQIRSLQELGWDSELKDLLLSKREEIERSGDLMFLEQLYAVSGEKEKLLEIRKRLANSTFASDGCVQVKKEIDKNDA